jgi:AraC family transcriptional regulator, transcriptional activator of the genes for pyochelin and ferripyochelin receptors
MGLRILPPSGEILVIQPFTAAQLKQRTVQLRCNVRTHEHQLVYGRSVKPHKETQEEFIAEFSSAVFRAVASTGTEDLAAFARNTKRGRSLVFSPVPLPLDAEMHRCVHRMIQYEGSADTKKLFLYARVIDLLLLQQESYVRTKTPKLVHVKSEYDKERIVFARDYLLTHMDAPPSLTQLAAIAGINEFKLKRGFKELFNNTVFAYLADIRLEMARRALLQKQKTVTQIAFELGYASLPHFSAAFKKKFGVAPGRFA